MNIAEIIALAKLAGKGGGASSWNDLKDKPFHDSRWTGEIKITFDGSIEGKEYMQAGDNSWLVKVSDNVPTTEEFMGGKVFRTWGTPGSMEYEQLEELWEPEDLGNGLYFFEPDVMFATKDISMEGIALTKGTWIYLRTQDDGYLEYISELSYTSTTGELKKLDTKYLPEDLVIDYSTDTPEIVSGSVNAVLQKLATHQKACVTILRAFENPDMIYLQYTVTGLSGYTREDGYGKLYIHFMYFEFSNNMSDERIFVFSADGQHEKTITSSGAPM